HEWRSMSLEWLMTARKTEDGIYCRAIGDTPPSPYASAAAPTVEEGYTALISSLPSEDGQ
ncbi:hypothetical protein K0U00_20830, partial [Paenibacillus sepulcri]|nr:hypothetical protein [Paenibacillus sepulcri]